MFDQRSPRFLAAGDGVEVLFQRCGEIVIDIAAEVFGKQFGDDSTNIFRIEDAFFQSDVFAGYQRVHDAGVGGWTADTVLFESFNQARFCEARWRLSEVLFRSQLLTLQNLVFAERGQ